MPKELRLQTKILKALRTHGGWWAEKSASLYESNGLPDIYGGYYWFFIVFEVKRPNQPYGVTRVQELIIEEMKKRNAVYHGSVIQSVEEALSVLREIDEYVKRAGTGSA
jgi:hypothetical protein